jgi:hypothetical protein
VALGHPPVEQYSGNCGSGALVSPPLIYILHGHNKGPSSRRGFVIRVVTTYGLTLLICALMLFRLGQLDLFNEPLIGLKRTIIVAFPASFAATAFDSLADKNLEPG